METFFVALFFLSILALIVGIVKPSLFSRIKIPTRKMVGIVFGGLILVSFIGIAITVEPTEQPQQVEQQNQEQPTAPISSPVSNQPVNNQPAVASDTYLVVRVIDGDTIEIEGGKKVRYIGIDTPETVDPRKPVQCFGVEASNKNKELVSGKRVRLEKDVSETDQYGRLLRYVYVGDTFVNLELVKQGYAYASSYPPDVKYQSQFTDAQRVAKEQNKGLWGSCQESTQTSTPAPTATPQQSPGGSGYSVPSCSSTDCDCGDFNSKAHAQWFYDNYDPNNTHRLDGSDKDGLVCETTNYSQ